MVVHEFVRVSAITGNEMCRGAAMVHAVCMCGARVPDCHITSVDSIITV